MSESTQDPVPPSANQPQPPPEYGTSPQPMSPTQERQWGMISHVIPVVAMVISAGFLGFVASIVVYAIYKDRGPFVRQSAANALNIQIMEFIVAVISIPLLFVLIGFITLPLAIIGAAILHIIAAVKANNGEWYNPPFVPRFVK